MQNGPYGRAAVHLNNGQGISLYVMIPASGNFAEMLKINSFSRSLKFKILSLVSACCIHPLPQRVRVYP